MATLSGADADALDAAANELHKAAEQLRSGRARVERPLHAAPWNGRGADAFRHEWSTNRRAEILAAASFLDGAVQTLRRNADEQRRASGHDAAQDWRGDVQAPDGMDDLSPELERIKLELEKLGLGLGAIEDILKMMLALAATPGFDLGAVLSTIENLGRIADVADAVDDIAGAIDVVGYVINFAQSLSDYSHLPFDEMMLAAGVTVGLAVAKDLGAEVAGKVAGFAVTAGLTATGVGAPAGPIAGFLTSKLTSFFVGKGMDIADDKLNISENAVEASLDAYRYLKTHDLGDMALDGVEAVGDKVVEGGKNFIEDGKNAIEGGKRLWDKVMPG